MKSFLRSATALAGIALAGSAFAADLPRRAAPPVFTPVPVFTWTGFYVGFNAGYAFGTQDRRGPSVIDIDPATGLVVNSATGVNTALTNTPTQVAFPGNRSLEGFAGGGQVGYNYQFTPGSGLVVGIEADAQYVDFGRDRNRFLLTPGFGPAAGANFFNPNGLSSLDYFGTVRGRVGYAFDRVLFYGTGGFAYGGGGGREFGLPNSSRDDFRTGYAAGGGVEYALPTDSFLNFFRSSAVTLKVEGLYVNLDRGNRGLNGAFAVDAANNTFFATGFGRQQRNDDFAVVRAGLNYKFGSY